jgi:hypothetical protein
MPGEDVEMMHLGKICSLGHTPPHSVLSTKAFSTQQYTSFLLTTYNLIKSNFLCPKIENDPHKKDHWKCQDIINMSQPQTQKDCQRC